MKAYADKRKDMAKRTIRFFGWLAGIVAIGIAAFFGFEYMQYRTSEEYQAEKFVKNWERQYTEDTYGGDTPEETLRLFISALKSGDTELAAKYFVVDEQEKWRKELIEIKEKELLGQMIQELQQTKLTTQEKTAFFTLTDENSNAVSELIMHKNPLSNKWKITEL